MKLALFLFCLALSGPATAQVLGQPPAQPPATPPPAADAPTSARVRFSTGNWQGSAWFKGEQFSHCSIGIGYQDRRRLILQLYANGNTYVGATKPDWSMNPGSNYEIRLDIDGTFQKAYPGTVNENSRTTMWLRLGNDVQFRDAFGRGQTLTLTDASNQAFKFNVAGAAGAMKKLIGCGLLFAPD